jgi:tripartite-type tricarboxylate transporter receptor subunit TctC
LAEFIAWAKARPNGINLGSPGVGTTPHLSGELFGSRAGLTVTHVPFRGAAQPLPALLAGDVDFAIDNLASYVPAIQQGQLRALAVTSAERWPHLPDVPTMAEAGMPDFVVTSWAGWVLPKGTPRVIVDRLADTQRRLAADQDLQQRFLTAGGRLVASTPEEFAARAARERPMWREMVRLSGAMAD